MNSLAALILWSSMATLIVANNAIGDTLIAARSGALVAEIYKAVVPLPYIALCAWVYVRRTALGGAFALLGLGILWALSTVMVDVALARLVLHASWRLALIHYAFWEGYWFILVPLAQLAGPLLAAYFVGRRSGAGA